MSDARKAIFSIALILTLHSTSPHAGSLLDSPLCGYKYGNSYTNTPVGLSIVGKHSIDISNTSPGQPVDIDVKTYIEYSLSTYPTSQTYKLRYAIWAVPYNHVAGPKEINGFRIGEYTPSFSSGSGSARDFLKNGESSDLTFRTSGRNPPNGNYCMVLSLEQMAPSICGAENTYCLATWVYLPGGTIIK